MAVQDAQAPGREDQGAGRGEEDPDQADGEEVVRAGEPGGDHLHEKRRGEHAQRHQRRGRGGEQPGGCAGHAVGLLLLAAGQQVGVDGDERAREHALAEQVLQEVGDAQRGVEDAGDRPAAQVVGEDPLADEAAHPRQEDAGRDQRGVPPAPPRRCSCVLAFGDVGGGRHARGRREARTWRRLVAFAPAVEWAAAPGGSRPRPDGEAGAPPRHRGVGLEWRDDPLLRALPESRHPGAARGALSASRSGGRWRGVRSGSPARPRPARGGVRASPARRAARPGGPRGAAGARPSARSAPAPGGRTGSW